MLGMLILNRETRVEAAVAAQSGHIVTTVTGRAWSVLCICRFRPLRIAASTSRTMHFQANGINTASSTNVTLRPDINQTGQRAKESQGDTYRLNICISYAIIRW